MYANFLSRLELSYATGLPPALVRILSAAPTGKEQDEETSQENTPTPAPLAINAESEVLPTLEQVFCIVEVDQAEPLVGNLFRRRFRTDSFPDDPRHFGACLASGWQRATRGLFALSDVGRVRLRRWAGH